MNITPYQAIEQSLKSQSIVGKLTTKLANKEEAYKYIASVLVEIEKTIGDEKKDLTKCTPDSIGRAIIDAASFQLPIDGRGLAHLVKYGNKATFQLGYRGLLYKISEHYKNVNFTAEIVFKDDEFSVNDIDGYQSYTHKKANPFESNQANMIGVIAVLQYEDNGKKYQKVVAMPKSEIDQIRKTAKQDFIWSAWYYEKAKVAALKRLCKINFATVMGIQELIAYDNQENHDVTPKPVASDINKIIEAEIKGEVIDANPKLEDMTLSFMKMANSAQSLEELQAIEIPNNLECEECYAQNFDRLSDK